MHYGQALTKLKCSGIPGERVTLLREAVEAFKKIAEFELDLK